jgi:hypothetical protein
MANKGSMLEEDVLMPMEELAMFKFDEELALEETRKPKAPKAVMNRRGAPYSRRTTKYAPQWARASDGSLSRREHETRMVNEK